MKKSNENLTFPILSLFSGGGFLDIGFMNQGFQIKEAVEINPNFIRAYNEGLNSYASKSNNYFLQSGLIKHKFINSPKDLTIKRTHDDLARIHSGIKGIIGGPPCQDFSIGGKNKGINGSRGILIYSYFEIVKQIKPSFIFFENVPGLYKTQEHSKSFFNLVHKIRRLGYSVWYQVLNALEYNIPQDRPRIVLVAFKSTIVNKLKENGFQIKNIKRNSERTSNENFIFNWPKVHIHNPKSNFDWPKKWPFKSPMKDFKLSKTLNEVKSLQVNTAFKGLTNNSPNQDEFFQPKSKRFIQIEEGDTNRKSFKRLHRYRYSPTVAYGNNEVHLHPTQPRRLTVREALRLQSVPDSYVLPKEIPLTHKFKLISNGVPSILAELIALEIRRTLLLYEKVK